MQHITTTASALTQATPARRTPLFRSQHLFACVLVLLGLAWSETACQAQLPSSVRQLLVARPDSWDSTTATMQCYSRNGSGPWKPDGAPVTVLLGRAGLAWGRGVFGQGQPGRQKMERDKRSPAGIFAIGKIYTYDRALPEGAEYPFHTVTSSDVWVDDPTSPDYNRHLLIPPAKDDAWTTKQRMRLGDFAYRWLLEIRHNSDTPIIAGGGSAIFFHIRRGPTKPSVGCTTMAEGDLRRVITWLRAKDNPHYVLLPEEEYRKVWKTWKLPQ